MSKLRRINIIEQINQCLSDTRSFNQLQNDIPIIFCVLTDTNLQQAIDRSGGKHGNKGTEAAIAAIKLAQLRKDTKL